MTIELPALPYADTALEPTISANTISFHYGKHHNAYVVNLNGMIESLSEITAQIRETAVSITSATTEIQTAATQQIASATEQARY